MTRGSFQKTGERTQRGSIMTDEKKTKAIVVTDPGLLNRTSWTNASVALTHIKKVRANDWRELTKPNRGASSIAGA